MERVTEWRGEHAAILNHHVNYIDRLARYEDTGREPGEIVKIGMAYEDSKRYSGRLEGKLKAYEEAEADGRLMVLPRKELFEKIGDDVYVIDDGEIIEAFLCLVGFDHTGKDCIMAIYGKSQEDERCYEFRFADVGKTVFLSREEAEQALDK